MTLTKVDLAEKIHHQCGLSKQTSAHFVESVLETMKSALASGEDIMISGFGKFHVREKKSRLARNLHTGEFLVLGDQRVVTFKCSTVLKEKLNGKG